MKNNLMMKDCAIFAIQLRKTLFMYLAVTCHANSASNCTNRIGKNMSL